MSRTAASAIGERNVNVESQDEWESLIGQGEAQGEVWYGGQRRASSGSSPRELPGRRETRVPYALRFRKRTMAGRAGNHIPGGLVELSSPQGIRRKGVCVKPRESESQPWLRRHSSLARSLLRNRGEITDYRSTSPQRTYRSTESKD